MKYNYLIILFLFFCCEEEVSNTQNVENEIVLIHDQTQFNNAWNGLSGNTIISDPFSLNTLSLEDKILKVQVSYGGGCEAHQFKLLWPDVNIMIYPPEITAILTHDANGDSCEAYLSDEIDFDLSLDSLGLSDDDYAVMKLTVINGSNQEETLSIN